MRERAAAALNLIKAIAMREPGECEVHSPTKGTIYCGKCGRMIPTPPGICSSRIVVDEHFVECSLPEGHEGRHTRTQENLDLTISWKRSR